MFAPYGLAGGGEGARGENLLTRGADGRRVRLASKASVDVKQGDVFLLATPGGGGYGTPGEEQPQEQQEAEEGTAPSQRFLPRGSVYDYQRSQESC